MKKTRDPKPFFKDNKLRATAAGFQFFFSLPLLHSRRINENHVSNRCWFFDKKFRYAANELTGRVDFTSARFEC